MSGRIPDAGSCAAVPVEFGFGQGGDDYAVEVPAVVEADAAAAARPAERGGQSSCSNSSS